MLTWTREALRRMLSLMAGGTEPPALDGAKVGLFKTPITPTVNTVLADLDPADFTGYALSAAIVWDAPIFEIPSLASVEGTLVEFVATDAASPNTIYGAYIMAPSVVGPPASPNTLLAVDVFDAPIGVAVADDGVRYTPRVTLPL